MPGSGTMKKVFHTGENHFCQLEVGDTIATAYSFFRFMYTKHGPGQVAMIWSDLKGDGFSEPEDYYGCLTDNVSLARWLKDELAAEYPGMVSIPDYETMPIVEADYFGSSGDLKEAYTETVRAKGIEIVATWRGMTDPVRLALPETKVWPFTVDSLLVPASSAEVFINGVRAVGQTKPHGSHGVESPVTDQVLAHDIHGSGALSFGETWLETTGG